MAKSISSVSGRDEGGDRVPGGEEGRPLQGGHEERMLLGGSHGRRVVVESTLRARADTQGVVATQLRTIHQDRALIDRLLVQLRAIRSALEAKRGMESGDVASLRLELQRLQDQLASQDQQSLITSLRGDIEGLRQEMERLAGQLAEQTKILSAQEEHIAILVEQKAAAEAAIARVLEDKGALQGCLAQLEGKFNAFREEAVRREITFRRELDALARENEELKRSLGEAQAKTAELLRAQEIEGKVREEAAVRSREGQEALQAQLRRQIELQQKESREAAEEKEALQQELERAKARPAMKEVGTGMEPVVAVSMDVQTEPFRSEEVDGLMEEKGRLEEQFEAMRAREEAQRLENERLREALDHALAEGRALRKRPVMLDEGIGTGPMEVVHEAVQTVPFKSPEADALELENQRLRGEAAAMARTQEETRQRAERAEAEVKALREQVEDLRAQALRAGAGERRRPEAPRTVRHLPYQAAVDLKHRAVGFLRRTLSGAGNGIQRTVRAVRGTFAGVHLNRRRLAYGAMVAGAAYFTYLMLRRARPMDPDLDGMNFPGLIVP